MKIYTKTGDQGFTSLLSGNRVPKHFWRLHIYGGLDSLNSQIGFSKSLISEALNKNQSAQSNHQSNQLDKLSLQLTAFQHHLFAFGSHFAADSDKFKLPELSDSWVNAIENFIDDLDEDLPELKNFILPGGSVAAASLHICRTQCREVERLISNSAEEIKNQEKLQKLSTQYLNRLSDYFFVASRYCNLKQGVTESIWKT